MKRATIYIAAALLASGAVATYATTPETVSAVQTQQMQTAPYANMTTSKQLLLFVSQAERLVYKKDTGFAKMHLNEALSAAARLPSSPDNTKNTDIHRVTMITTMDGTRERKMMLVQPAPISEPLNFSDDALPTDVQNIKKAEVIYLKPHWNKADVLVTLNNTLRSIETGKKNAASSEFAKLHSLLLANSEHEVSERRAAQDNVALARILLQVGATKPAKLALANADDHMRALANSQDKSPNHFQDIATIRNEMAEMNKLIERNDPSAFKTLDAKLEKWWNALS